MIGILVVTHANLGKALIETVEFILNDAVKNAISISIDIRENPETLKNKIKKGLKQLKNKEGIIIFTDMFGGTPSNLSYAFLEEGKIEVISGVNLPILLKAVTIRSKHDLTTTVSKIMAHGQQSISLASDILK